MDIWVRLVKKKIYKEEKGGILKLDSAKILQILLQGNYKQKNRGGCVDTRLQSEERRETGV